MIFYGRHRGMPVVKTVLENEFLYIETMNLGASLLVFKEKRSGKDVVLGTESVASYLEFAPYCLGGSVGRCAKGTVKETLTLKGEKYRLSLNSPPHSSESDDDGFHLKVFAVREAKNEVVYSLRPGGSEEGCLGNVNVEIRYFLQEKELLWEVKGNGNQDILFHMTNHSYFNLLGSCGRTVIGQYLQIPSAKVGFVDGNGLVLPDLHSVEGTPFDFRRRRKIGEALKESHPNLRLAKGFDHSYVFQEEGLRACLESADLSLKVFSDYPSMHLYSGNDLPGIPEGKNGYAYGEKDGICFGCQYYPDAVYHRCHESPLLRKGETKSHWIRYRLEKTSL